MAEDNNNKIWEQSKSKPVDFNPDVEAGLDKLKARIRAEKQPAIRRSLYANIVKFAAAAAVLAGIGFYFLNSSATQDNIAWQIIETNAQELKEIQLSDGSQIALNDKTYFAHPETFADNHRKVKLDGEAFFNIVRDENRPFTIELDHGTVKVLGTSFNIDVDNDKKTTTVSVATGTVAFSPVNSSQEFTLNQHDKIVYHHDRKTYAQYKDQSANDWSWKTKKLTFNGTGLKEAIPAIEKHYGINIELDNRKLYACRSLTTTYNDMSLQDFIEAFSVSMEMKVDQYEERAYLFYGGECH